MECPGTFLRDLNRLVHSEFTGSRTVLVVMLDGSGNSEERIFTSSTHRMPIEYVLEAERCILVVLEAPKYKEVWG